MLVEDTVERMSPDFDWIIERRIADRTHGRVRQLNVDVTPQRVVVRGFASSYYVKQLAVAAVSEALASASSRPTLQVDIQVGLGGPRDHGA